MKLKYITNTDLTTSDISSQIKATATAFYDLLGDDFKCFVAKKTPFDEKPFNTIFHSKSTNNNSLFGNILFHIGAYKEIKKSTADTVIYSQNLSVIYLAQILGYKSAWELHDELGYIDSLLLKKIKNLTILAISEALIKYYDNNFSQFAQDNNHNIVLSRNGIYTNNYDKYNENTKRKLILIEQFKLPIDRTIIVHSGKLYRGQEIKLFETILEKFPDILFLQISNTDDDIKFFEKTYSQYLNIKFISIDTSNKLIEYQLCADLLFLSITKDNTKYQYSFPTNLFEYMATKIPIIGSRLGASSEIINQENAIIYDEEDEKSLINAIKWYQDNQDEAKRLANQAYQDIQMYDWDKRAKNIIDILQS
jgi:glycosyltransferase involved in cell wall biosynthesis